MQKIIVLLCAITLFAFGQCMTGPLSGRIGIKGGFNYCTFDPEPVDDNYNGMGFHIGVGMGVDILSVLSLDMTPTYRSTVFGTDIGSNATLTYSYSNLYLPVQVSIKAGLPVISPYLGLGAAGNFQMNGSWRFESGSLSLEGDINDEDLENDFFLIGAIGAQIKLVKVSVIPELSINYNLSSDLVVETDPVVKYEGTNIDIHLSVGFYMSL